MLRLADIMTSDALTVAPGLNLQEALERFAARGITGAPVVIGTEVVGVVSLSDIVALAARPAAVAAPPPEAFELATWDAEGGAPAYFTTDSEAMPSIEAGAPRAALEACTVDDVMTRRVWALSPETPVDRAAALMRAARIHRVLVMNGAALVGLVTTKDIARALASHRVAVAAGPDAEVRDA